MNSTAKHAYLIMAHNNFTQLQVLLSLLDDCRNDIYLHIDKKAETFSPDELCVQHSNLFLVDRITVNWGGHSQISCELNLLKAATANNYQYYHLLSGVDLPLKTQNDIHDFFDRNYPSNYIRFDKTANETGNFLPRISNYHFLQDVIGRNSGLWIAILEKIEVYSLALQNKLKMHRKQYIQAYKGTNWFSITHDLANYVIEQEKLIKKQFYFSICADEVFLHSIAMASPYRNSIINDSLRATDWCRGNPYVYRQEDVKDLLLSTNLFARKFDMNIDCAAIDDIVAYLTSNG